MKFQKILFYCLLSSAALLLVSCAGTGSRYAAGKKYSPTELKNDLALFKNILDDAHPGFYWFTPKHQMDEYFNRAKEAITDSLSERAFRTGLMYLAEKIKCGHTTIRFSKSYSEYLDTAKEAVFPITVYFWKDSAMVWNNINRNDSVIKRGLLVRSINNLSVSEIRNHLFEFLPGDGYSVSGKLQALNNGFAGMWKNVYGLRDSVQILATDSAGVEINSWLYPYYPKKDTALMSQRRPAEKRSKKEQKQRRKERTRSMQIDTATGTAYMQLNSFSRGFRLKNFFNNSFGYLKKENIENLIIDLRSNGGGDAGNSVALLRYTKDSPFVLADSLYAIQRNSKYKKYIKQYWAYQLMMKLVTHKKKDGNYHFGYFERKVFKPHKRNHYNGNLYLLTGGNTFSAASIFAKKLKGQQNVTIIGEETGGGAYGNSAWMIPQAVLPNTGIRFRLPQFKMIMDASLAESGRGVMPDIEVQPTAAAIRAGKDIKLETAKRLIEQNKTSAH